MQKDIHGGNIKAVAAKLELSEVPEVIHDFSVNINPFGMPSDVERLLISLDIEKLSNYPEVYAQNAIRSLAKAHHVTEECILVGNGSTEIFSWIISAFKPKKAYGIAPNYSGYQEVCQTAGVDFEFAYFAKKEDDFNIDLQSIDFKEIPLIFLGSPNNPTGVSIPRDDILKAVGQYPDTNFVIDESFMDFLPDYADKSLCEIRNLPENVIVVKSMTKFFALAGLRLGMVYANKNLIAKFAEKRLPWSVNSISQQVAQLLYNDENYICETRRKICELRKHLAASLKQGGEFKVFPGEADFLLCQITNGSSALELQRKLLENGILIRTYNNVPGLDESFFRIAVKDEDANKHLVDVIKDKKIRPDKNKKPLMIVGTTSGSGKSVITAAFCRYFARKGIKVAPFKAQNMSLNSFVTKEGGEMGRAQVFQAQAAMIEPHTDMNPVLLKPTGDAGSQLIVNGKVVGNFGARDYYEKKSNVREDAHAAFDRLSAQYDLIVLEGAGSPAEINLMKEDFVNMAMAEYAKARTILVADINPGGVFASIFGTIKLLPEKYRKLIDGIIINKFRGDVSLLQKGIDEIEELTGIPVLGVLPFVPNLNIEEEDSMDLDEKSMVISDEGTIDIAVVRLPRISNYTDFLPLETTSGVNLRYVSEPRKLDKTDLVIIPGTKNTINDMVFLKESGFEQKIRSLRQKGIPVIGICGGFQMLGKNISDPKGIEGQLQNINGLGFLDCNTEITPEKELAQVTGKVLDLPFADCGTEFSGYEIHMGLTRNLDSEENSNKKISPPLEILSRRDEKCAEHAGMISADGLVFGCYVHGFFDSDLIRKQLVQWLAERKGKKLPIGGTQPVADPFDRLADLLEEKIRLDF